jgi:hypothetical protein
MELMPAAWQDFARLRSFAHGGRASRGRGAQDKQPRMDAAASPFYRDLD